MINVKVVKKFAPFTIEVGCETLEAALSMRESLLELSHLQGSKRSHLFARHLIGLVDSCLPSSEDDECEGTFADELFHPHREDGGLDIESLDGELETIIRKIVEEEAERKTKPQATQPLERRGQELETAEDEARRKAKLGDAVKKAMRQAKEGEDEVVQHCQPPTPCYEPAEPSYKSDTLSEMEEAYQSVGDHWRREGRGIPLADATPETEEPRYVGEDHPYSVQGVGTPLYSALRQMELDNPSEDDPLVLYRYRYI